MWVGTVEDELQIHQWLITYKSYACISSKNEKKKNRSDFSYFQFKQALDGFVEISQYWKNKILLAAATDTGFLLPVAEGWFKVGLS